MTIKYRIQKMPQIAEEMQIVVLSDPNDWRFDDYYGKWEYADNMPPHQFARWRVLKALEGYEIITEEEYVDAQRLKRLLNPATRQEVFDEMGQAKALMTYAEGSIIILNNMAKDAGY